MKPADRMERSLCGAKGRSGQPCRKPPLLGGVRCRLHGGASPQALRRAEETLQEWRLRRVKQLDRGLDVLLNQEDGKRLAGLIVKQPGLVARLLEVADRLRGGGERIALEGHAGGPVDVRVVDPVADVVANDPEARAAAMALLGALKRKDKES